MSKRFDRLEVSGLDRLSGSGYKSVIHYLTEKGLEIQLKGRGRDFEKYSRPVVFYSDLVEYAQQSGLSSINSRIISRTMNALLRPAIIIPRTQAETEVRERWDRARLEIVPPIDEATTWAKAQERHGVTAASIEDASARGDLQNIAQLGSYGCDLLIGYISTLNPLRSASKS